MESQQEKWTSSQTRPKSTPPIVNLVVVSHPDDEVLGFGATGARLVSEGEAVQPVIMCGSVDVRSQRPTDAELHADMLAANALLGFSEPVLGAFPNIRMNTVPHVDLVRFIEEQIARFKPTRIFTHHGGDLNDDHAQTARACLAASRLFQRRDDVPALAGLYLMEIASSTDWALASGSASAFRPNVFVEVEAWLELKIQALGKYRRVMRPYPHPRSKEALLAMATVRGAQSMQRFAEAFELVFQRGL